MHRFLLGVIVAIAALTYAHGETDCENQKRNSQRSVHGMSMDIQCDSEGYYLPMQCTGDGSWCSCYNKTDRISRLSRKTSTCVCPLALNEAENDSQNRTRCHPQCDPENTGKFKPEQLCNGTRYCVDPNTGERRQQNSQSTTTPTSSGDLQCPN